MNKKYAFLSLGARISAVSDPTLINPANLFNSPRNMWKKGQGWRQSQTLNIEIPHRCLNNIAEWQVDPSGRLCVSYINFLTAFILFIHNYVMKYFSFLIVCIIVIKKDSILLPFLNRKNKVIRDKESMFSWLCPLTIKN
jgi:hypothetical protein